MTAPALGTAPVPAIDFGAIAERRFQQSMGVASRFFEAHSEILPQLSLDMARRFRAGGRLLVFGEGAQATDARHVSVEFVHPVIVGKAALPAIALTADMAPLMSGGENAQPPDVFARLLDIVGRDGDIAMGITTDGNTASVAKGLERGRQHGMLTVALAGGTGGALHTAGTVDFLLVVPSVDPMVVQEVHETAYHVVWELVHLFFEHRVVT